MSNTRNHSLPQLEALQTNRARILARALESGASFAHLETAAKTLSELAESALNGHTDSQAEYQTLLYILSLSDDTATALARRWLCNWAYRVEERFIPAADVPTALSEAEFLARIEQEVSSRSREKHPMSQYIFEGSASPAQLRVFLRRQWFRTFRLYREAADLLVNLVDVDDAAALGRYLHGELGEEDEVRSHPRLLAKLLNAVDLEADFQAVSTMPEEIAYLNNRVRSSAIRTWAGAWRCSTSPKSSSRAITKSSTTRCSRLASAKTPPSTTRSTSAWCRHAPNASGS
ncbi:HOASN domain-containing protein [Lysobacter capsici]|uniref:HOASN domain-containing protein n=1 Tax=Lysobacter capsici TaxID=435897 RepID=UPI00398CF617